MKIVVLSDTHGKINTAINIIEQQKPDMIIHLGDLVRDAIDLENIFKEIKIEYVAGNNDFYTNAPYEKELNIENKKILIIHGHKYRVKYGIDDIILKAKNERLDSILFGHTHESYEYTKDGILYFNPGSLTLPRSNKTYGLLEVRNGNIYSMICNI